MAEKLSESSWTSLTKKLKVELEDGTLIKALAKFDKTDAAKPEPRAEAASAVAEQIKKQVPLLVKQKKELGDKPFAELKDKLYALLELAEDCAVEMQAALSSADEEADSPVLMTSKMLPLLRELRKGGDTRMPALVCTAGKNTALLIMRRPISPSKRKLLAEAVDAKGGAKYITGECFLEKNALTFVVASPSAGLAKRLRQALLDQTQLRLKVRVRGEDGAEDEDGEDEEAHEATESQAEDEGEPQSTQPSPEALSYQQRLDEVQARLDAALKAQHPESTKLRALIGFAQDKAGNQDFAAALQSLGMLEKLLNAGAAPTAPAPGGAPSQTGEGPSFVNMQKARLAWLQTRQAVQGELKKLESSILVELKDEPNFAEIQRDVRGIDQVLQVLDEELADTLDAALNASDPAERHRLHLQAREQLDAYDAYVTADPFVAELDSNPFAPIKIREIVTRSLAVLSKTLV